MEGYNEVEKLSVFDRILLFLTGFLAAYQIAIGIDHFSKIPIIAYTIGFGVLLLAGLLIIILGFEVLDSPIVVIISSAIPLSLSLGLVWEYLIAFRVIYLVFIIFGYLAIMATRIFPIKNSLPLIVVAVFHGVAGLIIFILPEVLVFSGQTGPIFSLVGFGGALIGIGGLLLVMLRAGKSLLSRQTIFRILPILLLLMTVSFVLGFSAI
jgi:hypothetical protein